MSAELPPVSFRTLTYGKARSNSLKFPVGSGVGATVLRLDDPLRRGNRHPGSRIPGE